MTEPLLRDGLSEFGRSLFEAADADAPSSAARAALMAAVVGAAAATTVTAASGSAAAAVNGGVATHAGAGLATSSGAGLATSAGAGAGLATSATASVGTGLATSAGAAAGLATKGAAALGLKLLLASAIGVATTAAVVGELRDVEAPTPAAVVSGVAAPSHMPAPIALAPVESMEPPAQPADEEEAVEPPPAPIADAPTLAVRAPTEVARVPTEPTRDPTSAVIAEAAQSSNVAATAKPVAAEPVAAQPLAAEPLGVAPPSTSVPEPARAAPPGEHANANASSLREQIASIDGARAAMRAGEARRALATIEAFEHRYGSDAPLLPEALLVRVQAHLALGERAHAERAARALIHDHPSSVSARRAASIIGAHD